MDGAPGLPTPLLRALEGLGDGVGRLLLITGPANSGKSGLLDLLRDRLVGEGVRVTDLQGTYHDREVPNAALAPLNREAPSSGADSDPVSGAEMVVPIAGLGAMADDALRGGGGRRRGGERRQGRIMGVPYQVRTRGGASMDPGEYWRQLCADLGRPGSAPIAFLVEDGSLVDSASRDFLLYLAERVRFRPVLIAVSLDVGEPGYAGWEERLVGRNDVDWVRRANPRGDPREAHRLKQTFDRLPAETQRALGFAALLGGSATEVTLSRVTRLSFGQLGDALLPATEAHLVRVEAGKVAIPHAEWSVLIREFLPNKRVREMHREIAEALEAMSPEPTLARRTELAEHFFHWEAGPTALRFLLEAAELTERLSAFDGVLNLVDEAIACLGSLPSADRPLAEVELRLFRTRALIFAGRPGDAEAELRSAVTQAIDQQLPPATVEEWVELLLPALISVGPRPGLIAQLGELGDRAQEAGQPAVAVLFQAIVAGHEYRRGRAERARHEARRAGSLARSLTPGLVQGAALLAIAVAYLDGSTEERELAERFRTRAHEMLGSVRRAGLQQIAEEVHAAALAQAGDRDAALAIHLRAIAVLQRMRLHGFELPHQLGVAELILDARGVDDRVTKALRRAREIVELLHLRPPAPSVLRLWLLEGRQLALVPNVSGARDRFQAIGDRPKASTPVSLRRAALLRLADLELSEHREDEARAAYDALDDDGFPGGRRPPWEEFRSSRFNVPSGSSAPSVSRGKRPRPR